MINMTIESEFPRKKYDIILADPPWEYGNYSNTKQKPRKFRDRKHGITPYQGMAIEEIKKLPVQTICKDNCALFLWVTYPCLQWGLDVVKAWGFEYKTVAFTWVKRNRGGTGWYFGLGNYTRANAEICLLGIKGSMKRESNRVFQICDSPITFHSKKPDVIRTRIVQLFGDLSRIELFARTRIHGWDTWGNDDKLHSSKMEDFI